MAFLNDRKFVTLRLPKAYLQIISDISKQYNIPRSRAVEMILEDYLVNDYKTKDLNKLITSLSSFDRTKNIGVEPQPIKDAVLIAGGIGSRLQPFTTEIVKPLIPIQGKPVIQYLVELFRHYGVENIYFSICYKPDQIKSYFGNGSKFGMKFHYLEEPVDKPMGTAYAMRLLKQYIKDKPFFMTNSDELKDIDLREFYQTYVRTNAKACIALTKVEDPTQYGVAKMDGDKIIAFVEKPTRRQAPSKLINSGLYIMHPSVMEMVPNKFTMTEKHIFPKLAKQGTLFGHAFDGQWFDTGTPERYKLAIEGWKGFSWSKKSLRSESKNNKF